MSFLTVQLDVSAAASPMLDELLRSLELSEQAEFMGDLAGAFEALTTQHIAQAAQSRHTTAARLGARPTGYLERLANGVEATPGTGRVTMRVQGEIFKRAFGAVQVTAQERDMLTLPWSAEAYGRRAREFGNLFVYRSKRGQAFLARREGKGKLQFLFLLKRSVTLPQDRGLLPSDEDYLREAEKAANRFIDLQLQQLRGS